MYLRIYEAYQASHLLSKFILDRLVLQDITYHTIMHGLVQHYRETRRISGLISYFGSGLIHLKMSRRHNEVITFAFSL
jgi:hypothetical protein